MNSTRRNLLLGGASAAFIPWHGASATPSALRGYLRTNWGRDPYTFGSYSFVAHNGRQSDRAVLGADLADRVYFAGEAVHPTHNATLHAAFESGQRAASRIGHQNHRRVAIIGAGISGLSAAQALSAQGHDITIFEARDRIGGRILTDRSLGLPLDLGASWIHGTRRNPISDLAEGLETHQTGDGFIMRGHYGRVVPWRQSPEWLEEVLTIQHVAGADLTELNYAAYESQFAYPGPDVTLTAGMDGILRGLEPMGELRLASPVSGVAYDGAGARLTLADGTQEIVDAVLVTVPLGVLKSGGLRFDPALPPDRIAAMDGLRMGLLDKVYLLFDAPFWDAQVDWIATSETALPNGQFNQWLNLGLSTGQPILMALNGGDPARDLSGLSDRAVIDRALSVLARAYP